MKTLLLFPLFIYLALMLVNIDLLKTSQEINLFWASTINIPVFLFSSIFLVLYTILVFIVYDGNNFLLRKQNIDQDKKIVKLKAKLYDWQDELLDRINSDYEKSLESFQKDNNNHFDKIIKFNEYTLEKVITETWADFNKYKKETKKLLNADKSIVDKLKVWQD